MTGIPRRQGFNYYRMLSMSTIIRMGRSEIARFVHDARWQR